MEKIYLFVWIYLILLFLDPMLEVLTALKWLKIANKVARDFRNDAIILLENADIDFFKTKNKWAFLKIIDSAYSSIYSISEDILHRYLTSIGQVIGIFLSTIILTPIVLLIFIITSILSIINLVIFGNKEKEARIQFSQQEETTTGWLSEFLNNFRTIFYLNLFKKQETELFTKTGNSYTKKLNVITRSVRKWYNHSQLQQISSMIIFIFCVINVIKGNFTIWTLVIIITFADKLSSQMWNILALSETFMEKTTALQRYRDEMAQKLTIKPLAKTWLIKNNFQKLKVDNVSLLRDERDNLKNISFSIKKKEKIAIIGYTWWWKSSLLDVLLKATTDYTGEIYINGIDYKKLNSKDIVDIFSIVPQDVQLFKWSIMNNIISNSHKKSNIEIEKIIHLCWLTNFIKKLPNWINEIIFEGSTNISGWERQRIGIARALLKQHPFLILDEATASLDPKTEREVIKNIIEEYPNLSILYITHKYSLLDFFDKILVLHDGQIIESWSFNELKKSGALFKELYKASKIK